MKASESKWVNPVFNIIGINSLRLGGLQLEVCKADWYNCHKLLGWESYSSTSIVLEVTSLCLAGFQLQYTLSLSYDTLSYLSQIIIDLNIYIFRYFFFIQYNLSEKNLKRKW